MNTAYDPNEWATEVSLGRRVFLYNYALRGDEFRGWELVKTTRVEQEAGIEEKIFVLQRKGNPEEVMHVSVLETPYWGHALQHLKFQLEHCMRPDIPRGTGKIAAIGDVQFQSQAPDSGTVASVFFTRGNLLISVRSVGDTPVNVARFAAEIDERFTRPVAAARKKAEAVKRLKPATLAVKRGERAALLQPLPERSPRAGWVRVITPDGELRRENDVLYYSPDEAGQKRVEILNLKLE